MLTNSQLADLALLRDVSRQFDADIVIIGAAALQCFGDLQRFTKDVDVAVALDLEDFSAFSTALKERGWRQERDREHRWHGPNRSMLDMVPAGPNLRKAGHILWPNSEFRMSIIGFEHVFTRSAPYAFAPDVAFNVAPRPVVAFLKIVAYSENPHRRKKDLDDLKHLLHTYDAETDRIFGNDVFDAELEDIGYASAFLLGEDIGSIAGGQDASVVHSFLRNLTLAADEVAALSEEDPREWELRQFQMELRAFETGFRKTFASSRSRSG